MGEHILEDLFLTSNAADDCHFSQKALPFLLYVFNNPKWEVSFDVLAIQGSLIVQSHTGRQTGTGLGEEFTQNYISIYGGLL